MERKYNLGFGGNTIELNERQYLADCVLDSSYSEYLAENMKSEESLLMFAEGSEIEVTDDDVGKVFKVATEWLKIRDDQIESSAYHNEVLFKL